MSNLLELLEKRRVRLPDVACKNIKSWHIAGLLNKIKPAIDKEDKTRIDRTGQNHSLVTNVSIINYLLVMSQIREKSVILDKLEKEGRILIIGGYMILIPEK